MGLNIREILENVCYPELFLSFLNDKKIGSKENAILEFYQQFACVEGDPVFSESLSKDLQKKNSFNKDVNWEGLVDEI
ncbi:putative DNA-directed RNA polymerase [Helianthus debilis subsp. tardiflorus]